MKPHRLWQVWTAGFPLVLLGATSAQAQGQAEPAEPMPCIAAQPGDQRLASGAVQAWWRTEPKSLRVGQPFSVLVSLCPAQAQLLRVDAHMPEHRHGMNYRPTLQPLGAGRWRAQGLLWHMPGRWELVLETSLAEQPQRLAQSIELR